MSTNNTEVKAPRKYERKPRSKLVKVNVPEMMFKAFWEQIPVGASSVIDKLRTIKPQPRGRGLTRVLPEITEDEWEDLYARVCLIRGRLKGCDRATQLRAAICAKAMSFRMEEKGVKSIIKYETLEQINGHKKSQTADDVVTDVLPDEDHTVTDTVTQPIELDTVDDVEEAGPNDLDRFMQEINVNS